MKQRYLKIKNSGINNLFPEEDLEAEMEKVEAYLSGICISGCLTEENKLYYELYPQEDAKGTIVISFGFAESARKYHELIYYFLNAGYQVAVMEHRGHGKSSREVKDSCVVHVDKFGQYADDLHTFVQKIVLPGLLNGRTEKKRNLYLFGHSMGGCIAASYLESYPGDFDRAILNAPMLGLELGRFPAWAAVLICDINILLGRGSERQFTHHVYDPAEPFGRSCAASQARHNYYVRIRRENIIYQTCAASYRWVREAIRAGRQVLRPKEAAKVSIPVLLFQAGDDTTVSPGAQRKFIGRIPDGEIIIVPGARHEIYRSGNPVLGSYLEAIFAFFQVSV